MSDAVRLKNLRLLLECADMADAMMAGEPEGMALAIKREDGRMVSIARFTKAASATDMELAATAVSALPFLIGLVDRAADAVRDLKRQLPEPAPREPDGEPKNFAAEAAIKCTEPAFKRFLMECHGLASPASDEAAAGKLRHILGITSRAELNNDALAAARWKDLRGAFAAWRKN
jgi:hypothetical protein